MHVCRHYLLRHAHVRYISAIKKQTLLAQNWNYSIKKIVSFLLSKEELRKQSFHIHERSLKALPSAMYIWILNYFTCIFFGRQVVFAFRRALKKKMGHFLLWLLRDIHHWTYVTPFLFFLGANPIVAFHFSLYEAGYTCEVLLAFASYTLFAFWPEKYCFKKYAWILQALNRSKSTQKAQFSQFVGVWA